jgi:hypothetical protein
MLYLPCLLCSALLCPATCLSQLHRITPFQASVLLQRIARYGSLARPHCHGLPGALDGYTHSIQGNISTSSFVFD